MKQSRISAAQEGFRVESVFPCRRYCAMEKRMRTVLRNGYIGLNPQTGKLVFVASRPKLSVIANQSADWCGNPPVERNQVTITTKNRKVFPLCGVVVDTFPH